MPRTRAAAPRPTESRVYESYFDHAALFEFSRVINSTLDPAFIHNHILLTIMGKILSTRGFVAVARTPGEFVVEATKGFHGGFTGTVLSISDIPHSMFHLDRIRSDRHPWVEGLREQGVKILLPMLIAERVIGVLGFGARVSKRRLQTREETYLRSLANISATAVEKCRTIDEIQQVNRKLDRKIQELNTLFELGKEFSVVLDPDKIVRLLVFSLLGQVGVNRYVICLREEADMRVAAAKLDGPSLQGELLMTLAQVRGAMLVADMHAKGLQDARDALAAAGMQVVVPMQIQGETRGVILLGEKISREPFLRLDLEFLSSLASLAIISLENARLFREAIEKQKLEDELLIAREIQKGLLPSVLPHIDGCDIAATNISSRQVGGDYYDILAVDGEKYVVAIGDVSGKGYPAALLMANLQASIRALVPLRLPLSELTRRVNDLMCHNTGGDKFITFFWCTIDPGTRTLSYVNAGHNYPYVLHADGTSRRLEKGGMILGVMPTVVPYEEETVSLSPGDILVLFTDGVSEAMNRQSVEYGEERLERAVRSSSGQSATDIAGEIHQDILRHAAGAPQSDDITMMIIKIS